MGVPWGAVLAGGQVDHLPRKECANPVCPGVKARETGWFQAVIFWPVQQAWQRLRVC